MITLHNKELEWYVDKLKNNEYYSIAGYSDAEWFSILGISRDRTTGLGQKMTKEVGERLGEVLQRRKDDSRFLVAIPDAFWNKQHHPGLLKPGRLIEKYVENNLPNKEFYERDRVTDYLADRARLHPFISQLQKMNTVLIGPKELGLIDFIGNKCFIPISSPNLHMEEKGIEEAVRKAKDYGVPGVYLVSAGMSAALIIDQLHDEIPNSFFIDCASIWDAFVGIGEQRRWRRQLYAEPEKLEEWKRKNIYGE